MIQVIVHAVWWSLILSVDTYSRIRTVDCRWTQLYTACLFEYRMTTILKEFIDIFEAPASINTWLQVLTHPVQIADVFNRWITCYIQRLLRWVQGIHLPDKSATTRDSLSGCVSRCLSDSSEFCWQTAMSTQTSQTCEVSQKIFGRGFFDRRLYHVSAEDICQVTTPWPYDKWFIGKFALRPSP